METTRLAKIDATARIQPYSPSTVSSRRPTSAGISTPAITTALRSVWYFHLDSLARESHHSTQFSQRASTYPFLVAQIEPGDERP